MPEAAEYPDYAPRDLGFGVVGFGKMGVLHSGVLNLLWRGCVRGVVDRSRLLVFGASRLLNGVNFHRELKGMLREDDPDVVYVTTPAESHHGIVSRLIESGVRYIFVEKPPTTNSWETNSLIDEMTRDQLVMVGFQKRFTLPFRHAKMLISEEVIGEVERVSAYIRSSDILAPTSRFNGLGRGVLLDLGVHLLDLLLWIFDAGIVEASKFRRIHTGVDDLFEARLRNEEGIVFDFEASWSRPEYRLPETLITVKGSKGLLRATEDYLKVEATEGHPLLRDDRTLEMYRPHYYPGVPPVNLADPEYTLENMHFLHCIHTSSEPLTSLRNVAGTMELVDELYRAAGV